ncbi:MAG: VWA domain-containing protein [Verrucomicrobiae bacterium]|nr:VWA domain-containing protein [Verrucomicrobiae bacterium]
MRFLHPEILALLALLPLLALWRGRRGRAPAIQYPGTALARQIGRTARSRAGAWLSGLRLLVLAFGIIALARPQIGRGNAPVEASGIDIVLAVDISGSMEALDFKLNGQPVNRVEVVKRVVSRFIEARPNDRIALIAFAGRPYLVSPLTLDHPWLLQNLDRLKVGLVEDGTAIGSAIASAANHLRTQSAKSKVVILLTDGINNAGQVSPIAAAEAARALGVKVYTIAAGTRGEAPIPARDAFGNTQIVMARVDVDEDVLRKIADLTGGTFERATDTASLRAVYARIDRMEKTTATFKKFERYDEEFGWPLTAGLAFLALELGLAHTRFRSLP